MIITIFDEQTNEIFACIDTDDNSVSIVPKGFGIEFSESDPMFTQSSDGRLFLCEKFFVKL